jgi:hypothetical protein
MVAAFDAFLDLMSDLVYQRLCWVEGPSAFGAVAAGALARSESPWGEPGRFRAVMLTMVAGMPRRDPTQ